MKKRIACLALVLIMAVSLVVPAFAEEAFDRTVISYESAKTERDDEGHPMGLTRETGRMIFSNAYQVRADLPFYAAEYREYLYYDYDLNKWVSGSGTYGRREWVTVIGPGCEITVEDALWGVDGIVYANNYGDAEVDPDMFRSFTYTPDGFVEDELPFITEDTTGEELIALLTSPDAEGRLFSIGLYDGIAVGSYFIYVAGSGTIPAYLEREKPAQWAAEDVNTAIAAGLVPMAMRDDYSKPITRAEFCSLAVALYETYMGGEISERKQFDDTIDLNVQKMAGLGVVNGVDEGIFNPDATLTREQAATILARLAEKMGVALEKKPADFSDISSVRSYALEPIGQMQASGIMGGTNAELNLFSPQGAYTRQQSIVTILRLFNIARTR